MFPAVHPPESFQEACNGLSSAVPMRTGLARNSNVPQLRRVSLTEARGELTNLGHDPIEFWQSRPETRVA